jgi:hypothetical protein
MTGPVTPLHYASGSNVINNVYAPGADGFNLADVSDVDELDALPAGVDGLVYLGATSGATASFEAAVNSFIGDPKLFGIYLTDEPDPSQVSAANLKAESDYVHAALPGVKTFIVLENMGSDTSPTYLDTFNPSNTDIDLFGLDPYPVKSQFPGGFDLNVISAGVAAAEAAGIPQKDLVPVYQAFGTNGTGAYAPWLVPTAAQEQQSLSTWGSLLPTPAFDYAYSWGQQEGDQSLSMLPALQAVFAAHNAGTAPPPPPDVITVPSSETSLTVAVNSATINASGGNHLFMISGDDNTFNLSGGIETVTDSGSGGNTFNLPAAGHGSAVFSATVLTIGDVFGLATALAATGWTGSSDSLHSYLHIEQSGANTELLVSANATRHASGTLLATFDNASVSLSAILAHSIT